MTSLSQDTRISKARLTVAATRRELAETLDSGRPAYLVTACWRRLSEARGRLHKAILAGLDRREAERTAEENRARETRGMLMLLADVLAGE